MATGKFLGKLAKVRFGMGGYQDAQFGLSVELAFDGYGSADFRGTWADYPPHAQYTREEWMNTQAETMQFVCQLLKDAKVDDVSKLVGKPIEVTCEGNVTKSWRLLTEVI